MSWIVHHIEEQWMINVCIRIFHLQIQSILNICTIYWERQWRGVWLPREDRTRKWRACEGKTTSLSHDSQLQKTLNHGRNTIHYLMLYLLYPCLSETFYSGYQPIQVNRRCWVAWESHHDPRRLKQLKTCGLHGCRNLVKFLSVDNWS